MAMWMLRWWVEGAIALETLADEVGGRLPVGRDERGQTTAEFAVVALVLLVAAIAAIQVFTNGVSGVFQRIVTKLQGVPS